MEYLEPKHSIKKSGLKFRCRSCGSDIIVRYLFVGEEACCHNCRTINIVPLGAARTDGESSMLVLKLKAVMSQVPVARITYGDKIKDRYKKIDLWVGVAVSIVTSMLLEHLISDNIIIKILISSLIGGLASYTVYCFRKEEEDSTPQSRQEEPV